MLRVLPDTVACRLDGAPGAFGPPGGPAGTVTVCGAVSGPAPTAFDARTLST